MNATKLCSIENCDKPIRSRGWCEKHYKRWQRYGNPETVHTFRTPEESFAARTEWRGTCLIWTGHKSHNGYGRITIKGQPVPAHRYSWQKSNGQIPQGKILDHTCFNRDCVNIEHLRLATFAQNSANRSGPENVSSKSGLRNVYKQDSGWAVKIGKSGKRHYFGTYSTPEKANQVAEKARRQLFGEYAGRG